MRTTMRKKIEALEQQLDAASAPKSVHVVFAPFPGICDKYSLTVPETGKRIEFDTEAAMLDWLTERKQQHILVSTVEGRRSRPKEQEGILLVPPPMTEEQWETAARLPEQEKACQASGECL